MTDRDDAPIRKPESLGFKGDLGYLVNQMELLQEMASRLAPITEDIPALKGMDIYGQTFQLNGTAGGDHLIFLDFNSRYDLDRRIEKARAADRMAASRYRPREYSLADMLHENKKKVGVLVADASGHSMADSLQVALLHGAFLSGVYKELDLYGEVTPELFQDINMVLLEYSQRGRKKLFTTAVYGEITEHGRFRFILSGHEPPAIFSYKDDRIINLDQRRSCDMSHPLGLVPSYGHADKSKFPTIMGYKRVHNVNEANVMYPGDILVLCTDGLTDHEHEKRESAEPYYPAHFERKLRQVKDMSAKDIVHAIHEDLAGFARYNDDRTIVVMKKL